MMFKNMATELGIDVMTGQTVAINMFVRKFCHHTDKNTKIENCRKNRQRKMPPRNFQVDTTDKQSACATMGVRVGESGLKLLSNLAPSSSV